MSNERRTCPECNSVVINGRCSNTSYCNYKGKGWTKEQRIDAWARQGTAQKRGQLVPTTITLEETEMTQTIEQLQAKNAELTAEVEEQRSDHMKLVEENHELRQQLAASQLEAKRLRDTMQKIAGHPEETPPFYWWQIYARNALSSPTSTEALDAYVAEKREIIQALSIGLDEKSEEISELTRQRDLAVSALEAYPTQGEFFMEHLVATHRRKKALAAIKESET